MEAYIREEGTRRRRRRIRSRPRPRDDAANLIVSYRIVSYRREFESGVVHSVLTYASTWKYSGLTESKPNLRHLRSLGLA